MSAMQLFYITHLPANFIGDEYSKNRFSGRIAMVILKEKPAPLNFTA